MTDNINYLFTNQTADGALVFRSTINSFGLDHITDKDLYSFYTKFSEQAYLDTGLLPVQGSGVLSIRSALNHTQVAYQHAPGKYYINWGNHEGDSGARKYYVAQPYRIVIIDFVNGNIYGARTFYSPNPITYPTAPLYHTNLPNINCRGYRGNGVGWICLYHTEDVSEYPFNEKLHKALERCSGVETYNDANMSETDGTRFYEEYRYDSRYLWDPAEWERKTEQDGVDWTLDEQLWLPVLVSDFDNQGKHNSSGHPLTFVDALFGDYRAYYSDELVPKPVNAISRSDKELNRQDLFNQFKLAFMKSQPANMPLVALDVFTMSSQIKESITTMQFDNNEAEEEENENPNFSSIECYECGTVEHYHINDGPQSMHCISYIDDFVCEDCVCTKNYWYDDATGEYHHGDSIYGKDLINQFKNSASMCFHLGDDEHWGTLPMNTMSFSRSEYVNDESLLSKLTDIGEEFPELYLHDSGAPWKLSFPAKVIDWLKIEAFLSSFLSQEGIFSSIFSPQMPLVYAIAQDVENAKFEISFDAMCNHCAHYIFDNDVSFKNFISNITHIVVDGLGNIDEYEIFSEQMKRDIAALVTAPYVIARFALGKN